MEEKVLTEEQKKAHDKIKKKVFDLEKENFRQKTLNSTQVVQKIKKIVEEEVK